MAVLFGLAGFAHAETAAQKGLRISTKVEKHNNGYKGESSEMVMVLTNAHGDTTQRKMSSLVMETKNDGDKSKIEFQWPADVKGTRMLTWSHKKGDDDQWLFLPSIKRVKRISSRNKSGSFMGSEFSYEDLGSQEVEKFTYKFLADEKVSGRDTWKIERIPTDKRSGYSKQIAWTDKSYMNPVKVEYYDRKGKLLKTAVFNNYKKYGKYWRVGEISMTNHQTRKKTTLTWKKRTLGKSFDEEDFASDELAD